MFVSASGKPAPGLPKHPHVMLYSKHLSALASQFRPFCVHNNESAPARSDGGVKKNKAPEGVSPRARRSFFRQQLVADALAQDCDHLITTGGAQL